MSLSRRNLLWGSGILFTQLAIPRWANATTARALTLRELRQRAARVAWGRPVLHESEWASVGGTRRIITRTRFIQEGDWLRGSAPEDRAEDEVIIWRLGGRVDNIVQKVPGEAQLPLHAPMLLFLEESARGLQHIVGMSQGSYSVGQAGGAHPSQHLLRSAHLPQLMGARSGRDVPELERPAVDVLHQRSFAQAFALVRSIP